MQFLFWDASALVKRYFNETGSDTVNALFTRVSTWSMASTPWGYTESYAVLLRKLNVGAIDERTFTIAVTALQAEVVNGAHFDLIPIEDTDIFESVYYIQRHNLNATDAAILTTLLELSLSSPELSYVLVASDQRLLRAAHEEGLRVLNPEELSPETALAFLDQRL